MKGPMLVGFEVFLETWSNGRRDVLFVVTTDEEIGGFLGAAKLLNKFRLIKLAIVLDGGSGEDVVVKQKAPFHIEITHLGKSAHASRPSEGVNSIHKLAECCLLICNKLECASITKIGGGEASNKIPDIAQAILDIRIKSKNLLQNAIKEISIATNEFGCSWMPIDKPVFFEVSAKNKFIKIFAKLSGRKFTCESGTSDARFLSDKQCIPTIVTSALGGNIHGNNEWVSWKSLIKLKDDIRNFINDLEVQL